MTTYTAEEVQDCADICLRGSMEQRMLHAYASILRQRNEPVALSVASYNVGEIGYCRFLGDVRVNAKLYTAPNAAGVPHTLYRNACESVESWKARALEAERVLERMRLEESPTFMGEPVLPHPDDVAVDLFAGAMKAKLAKARAKGRGGWANAEPGMQQRLSDMLRAHVEKGDPRDVSNFCCFLWNRGESILPASSEPVSWEADGMLPDALLPHADEWYRLCERRFAVDRMTISGVLAEAIVNAVVATDPVESVKVPEGWRLVPEKISISAEAFDNAQMVFGGPGSSDGEPFYDCTAWIGECSQDDGTTVYGLHLSCDEYPEEGSVTLAEFDAAPQPKTRLD